MIRYRRSISRIALAFGWVLVIALLGPARPVGAQSIDLTGFWRNTNARGDNYFPYRVRQVGDRVWWYAEDLPRVHNVFQGVLSGNVLTGEWVDLPGGEIFNTGRLQIAIESNDRMVKVGESNPYGGSVWVRQAIRTKPVYAAFEPIRVEFLGFPGNRQDWINVVKASDPPEVEGSYYYTEGKREGTFTYQGLPPGDYEARAFFNWPDGGRIIRMRQPFQVVAMDTGLVVRTQKPVYAVNEPIIVEYIGFPGNNADWVAVTKASLPDDQYGQFSYTGGKPGGFFSFAGLPAGDYEARAYFNWSAGGYVVKARYPFRVGEGGTGGGICANPRVLSLMDEWLGAAIPPQKEGESLRYEAWGRLVGRSLTATITVNGPPDTPLSRCEYLWSIAAQLNSTNGLGTLKEYVEKRLP